MNNDNKVVIALVVMFILFHLFFFPAFYASVDEHEYLRNTFLLQQGTLTEPDITQACTGRFNGQGYVNQYFMGRSIFLIPFTWLGFGAVMLSGLVIHLLNFFIVYHILKRLRQNIVYSLLYLLYPAFLWEARTLNSELLALTGLLAGTYFYLSDKRSKHVLAGLAFGFAALTRLETVLLSSGFFLFPLIKERRKLLYLIAGGLPVGLLMLGANTLFYGGATTTGYGSPLSFIISLGTHPLFFLNMLKFLSLLLLAYPLMLAAPFLKHPLRKEILLGLVFYVIFYSQNMTVAQFPFLHPTAFTSQLRYLIPLIGLLLISYPPLFEGVVRRVHLPLKPFFIVFIAALFIVSIAASSVHSSFLNGRHGVFEQIYDNTEEGSLIIGSSDDCNYILPELFGERAYLDVETEGLENYFSDYDNVYVLDISYSTVDYTSPRGVLVAKERQAIVDFIKQNRERMVMSFKTEHPHHLYIYRFV